MARFCGAFFVALFSIQKVSGAFAGRFYGAVSRGGFMARFRGAFLRGGFMARFSIQKVSGASDDAPLVDEYSIFCPIADSEKYPSWIELTGYPYFLLSVKNSIRKNFSFPFTIFLLFSSHPFRVVSYFSGLKQISSFFSSKFSSRPIGNMFFVFPEIFL